MQKYSSKNTSVNTSQLPAVYGKLNYEWIRNQQFEYFVDYGCGRAATRNKVFYKVLEEIPYPHHYFGYDPYWGDVDQNRNALSCLLTWKHADLCVCANVLNVIDDLCVLNEIVQNVVQAKEFVIQIYEGDKSRQGRKSKEDCYQRNEPVEDYQATIEYISGRKCYRRGNIIYSCKELIK